MKITDKLTGEVIELKDGSLEETIDSLLYAQKTIKSWEAAVKKLKKTAEEQMPDGKNFHEHGDYGLRISNVQRKTYDMTVLRKHLDEDTINEFLSLKKGAVDKYIAENLEELGEASTELRNTMLDDGKPYQVIKLERLNR